MCKTDENVCGFLFLFPLQMGVEGTEEGASGAQHSRKLVSFTLSGIKTKQEQKPHRNQCFTRHLKKKKVIAVLKKSQK